MEIKSWDSAFLNPVQLMTFGLPKGMIRNDLYSYLILDDRFWGGQLCCHKNWQWLPKFISNCLQFLPPQHYHYDGGIGKESVSSFTQL